MFRPSRTIRLLLAVSALPVFAAAAPGSEPSAGEREGLAPRMEEPSAGEREGAPLASREPSAGEREGAPLASRDQREGPAPREENDRLETMTVVGTRTERDVSEVAATITVIDADRIERELARNIADLVRFEPGVSVGGTGSRFGLTGFNIRGMDGNRVLTLIDGVRVPDEFSFGPFLSSRRDFVDVDGLGRAEIARGPISALWGSDAIGGVVAFTTLQPHEYLAPERSFHGAVKLGYASADKGANGAVTLAGGDDKAAALLRHTRREASEQENAGSVGGFGPMREAPNPQSIASDNTVFKAGFSWADAHRVGISADRFVGTTDTRILSDYGFMVFGTTVNTRDATDERTGNGYPSTTASTEAPPGSTAAASGSINRKATPNSTRTSSEQRPRVKRKPVGGTRSSASGSSAPSGRARRR